MLHFAIQTVRRASELATLIQSELVTPALHKADKSPVTVADLAIQAYIAAKLEEYDAAIPLVGEESADVFHSADGERTLAVVTDYVGRLLPGVTSADIRRWIARGQNAGGGTSRFWTLDPIDGTKGFLRGEQYAIALAYLEDGRVMKGVLGCPKLTIYDITGVLAYTQRGMGTWMESLDDDSRAYSMHASKIDDPADARVLRSVESGHTNVSQMDTLITRMGVKAPPVLMDSQAKYVVLAAGEGDMLFRLLSADRPDYEECIWDQAAGSILVEESGGTITDLAGKPLDFTHGRTLKMNRGICATNGVLHAEAINAINDEMVNR